MVRFDALLKARDEVCGAICPSTKRAGEPWTHSPLCDHLSAALKCEPSSERVRHAFAMAGQELAAMLNTMEPPAPAGAPGEKKDKP